MEVLPADAVEGIAKVVAEIGSGSDISRVISMMQWNDDSGQSTKWRRLEYVFEKQQRVDKSSKAIFAFIRNYFTPARFVNHEEDFEKYRLQLNLQLAFVGIEYGRDGQFLSVIRAKTISEAENRLRTLKSKMQGRSIHWQVSEYCTVELLHDDYFHAVFEATKGLAQRIRDMSGIDKDGAALVDLCFAVEHPILAFNSLQTETEQSEQKGFAQLIKGCFSAIRNPMAHEPKILWSGEDAAVDYLTLISLLHRKLDSAILVRGMPHV
jgi:uncharacterized protein (TIGR02391 family)